MNARCSNLIGLLVSCAALWTSSAVAVENSFAGISDTTDGVRQSISDLGEPPASTACDTLAGCCAPCRQGFFGAADYRAVRTHFSEAVAFATLTAGPGPQGVNLGVAASELNFDYRSSV